MRVMKFGGGCLRDAESFLRVVEIIQSEASTPLTIVVSAVFNVTNRLEKAAFLALGSEVNIPDIVNEIRDIHLGIINETITDIKCRENTIIAIKSKIEKLERLLYGVAYTGELFDTVRVLILSQGERLSACLLSGVMNDRGVKSKNLESDTIGLLTDSMCENATANLLAARTNLKQELLPLIQSGITPVVTGFFGCTEDGRTSSFGRNGSDYSAAVVTYALNADTLDIWKDVNGFMTADPQIVSSATSIQSLSYYEAAELSYFGAKILHPRTVEPLYGTNTEIRIRSINTPTGSYTSIHPDSPVKKDVIKSVTFNRDIVVLKIQGAGVGHKPGIIGEVGMYLSDKDINIYSVITSQTCINLLLDASDRVISIQALNPLVGGVIEKLDTLEDVALIAVVGEGLLRTKGLAARVFSSVAQRGVNVEMFSAGASEVAFYLIIQNEDMETAIEAIHNNFFS